jgi:hypothetical protein
LAGARILSVLGRKNEDEQGTEQQKARAGRTANEHPFDSLRIAVACQEFENRRTIH